MSFELGPVGRHNADDAMSVSAVDDVVAEGGSDTDDVVVAEGGSDTDDVVVAAGGSDTDDVVVAEGGSDTDDVVVAAGGSDTDDVIVAAGGSDTDDVVVAEGGSDTDDVVVAEGWSETEDVVVAEGGSELTTSLLLQQAGVSPTMSMRPLCHILQRYHCRIVQRQCSHLLRKRLGCMAKFPCIESRFVLLSLWLLEHNYLQIVD